MLRARVPLLAAVAAIALIAYFAEAGRGSGGTYSLPSGNPVVTGTTITSSWANNTLNDLSTEITNSLDRQGRGAMLAPLALTNGAVGAPGLTFGTEPTTGIYKAGTNDVRMSVASTDRFKWTSANNYSLQPFTVTGRTTTTDLTVSGTSDAITITPSGGSATALTATGTGGNTGVWAQGGPISGIGLTAVGGSPNGMGVYALGAGNQPGGSFVGGSTSGIGVIAIGGTNGAGGQFTGVGAAAGITAVGGTTSGSGIAATGGAPNGAGIRGQGTGSGAGIYAIGGASGPAILATAPSASTSTTRFDNITSSNGDISLDGTVAAASTTAIKNRITPTNLVKAWANITIVGATATIDDGFNVASIATSSAGPPQTNTLDITFAAPFASASYGVVFGRGGPSGGGGTGLPCTPRVYAQSSTVLRVKLDGFNNAVPGYVQCDYLGAGVNQYDWAGIQFTFMALGAQ